MGSQLDLPINTSVKELEEIINKLLENEDKMIYSFFFEANEVIKMFYFHYLLSFQDQNEFRRFY